MTLEDIKKYLDGINGITFYYGNFPENANPPYISYQSTEENTVFADGIKVYACENVELTLVTIRRDRNVEKIIEGMFREYGISEEKQMDFLEKEKIHVVTYEFNVERTM